MSTGYYYYYYYRAIKSYECLLESIFYLVWIWKKKIKASIISYSLNFFVGGLQILCELIKDRFDN